VCGGGGALCVRVPACWVVCICGCKCTTVNWMDICSWMNTHACVNTCKCEGSGKIGTLTHMHSLGVHGSLRRSLCVFWVPWVISAAWRKTGKTIRAGNIPKRHKRPTALK